MFKFWHKKEKERHEHESLLTIRLRESRNHVDILKGENEVLQLENDRLQKKSVGDMVARSLHAVEREDLDENFDTLEQSEKEELMHEAFQMTKTKLFNKVRNWLVDESIRKSAIESKTLDELNFNRATIRGVTLYVEEVEYLSNKYVELDEERKRRFDSSEIV